VNTPEMAVPLRALRSRFLKLYNARAMLHHYTDFVDVGLFDEANDDLEDVIDRYQTILSDPSALYEPPPPPDDEVFDEVPPPLPQRRTSLVAPPPAVPGGQRRGILKRPFKRLDMSINHVDFEPDFLCYDGSDPEGLLRISEPPANARTFNKFGVDTTHQQHDSSSAQDARPPWNSDTTTTTTDDDDGGFLTIDATFKAKLNLR